MISWVKVVMPQSLWWLMNPFEASDAGKSLLLGA
jgi:hypothetical protein